MRRFETNTGTNNSKQAVSSLLDRTEKLLNTSEQLRDKNNKCLEEKQHLFDRTKQECATNCHLKLEKVKESIVQEELDLERKYLRFEDNLKIK